jgi:hypothetical protein
MAQQDHAAVLQGRAVGGKGAGKITGLGWFRADFAVDSFVMTAVRAYLSECKES